MVLPVVELASACWKTYEKLKKMAAEAKENQEDFKDLLSRCSAFEPVMEKYQTVSANDPDKCTSFKGLEVCFEEIKKLLVEFSFTKKPNPERKVFTALTNVLNELHFNVGQLSNRQQYRVRLDKCEKKINACAATLNVELSVDNEARRQLEREQDLKALEVYM
jgi:hypothetical protein